MKVADLFAELGLRVNTKSFAAANKLIDGVGGKLKSLVTSKLAQLAGGLGFVAGVKGAAAFEDSLDELDIASQGALGSVNEMRKAMLDLSDETGITKEQVAAGAAEFVKLTGDGEAAAAAMGTFAKVSVATGASTVDLAKSAAALDQALGIKAPQFEKAFSILIQGGKKGAIELDDLSRVMAKLAPQAAEFAGGKGIEGLSKLGTALQLGRRGFGTAKETATGLQALFTSIKRNAKKFEAAGINVYDKSGSLRAFDTIIGEVAKRRKKLGAKKANIIGLLGNVEAERVFNQLVKIDGEWQNMARSTLGAEDAADDYAKRQKRNAQKLRVAINKVKNTLTRIFTVVLMVLVKVIDNLDLVALALVSIALAALKAKLGVIAFSKASIIAAAKTALAWAGIMAVFLLWAAVIAAVILIVEDLYRAFTGGQSVIGDMIEAWRDSFVEFFEWFAEKWTNFKNSITGFFKGFSSGELAAKLGIPKTGAAREEFNRRLGIDSGTGTPKAAPRRASGRAFRFRNSEGGTTRIVVNAAPGMDAEAVARVAKKKFDAGEAAKLRNAQSAGGR